MSDHHEEEVLGKAYDARLMRRLLRYLRPYVHLVVLALGAIFVHAGLQVVGPFLTKVAVDRYLTDSAAQRLTFLDAYLSPDTFRGLTQIAVIYVLVLVVSFAVEFLQTYTMQLTGQKAMFDLRTQIFAHLQRLHVGFFDRNPVGRLVTRLTTDIDALNEMFASGVVAIFGDFFTLTAIMVVMLSLNAPLALVTFAVLPLIALATALFRKRVRDSYRRIRTAIARINAYLQEHISGMAVVQLFNREEKSFREFETVNQRHMQAFKDAIFAHALFYPTVEILSTVAIGLILWYGGLRVLDETLTLGVVLAFIQYAQRFYRPIMDLSEKYDLYPLVIHDNYLINLASADPTIRGKSIEAFRGELERAAALGAEYLVAHPGSAGNGDRRAALLRFITGLEEAAQGRKWGRLRVLVENTAGGGGALGSDIEELRAILELAEGVPLGCCLDTAHCYQAGFDVSTAKGLADLLARVERAVGLESVRVVHTNDSRTPLGSRADRHEHIGRGGIGLAGFRRILNHPRLRDKAFILETPIEQEGDNLRNLEALRSLIRLRKDNTKTQRHKVHKGWKPN